MSADLESLQVQLAKITTGANAHTAGKAIFYLKAMSEKSKAKFSNCSREDFISAVRGAAYRNEWQKLSDLMARWW